MIVSIAWFLIFVHELVDSPRSGFQAWLTGLLGIISLSQWFTSGLMEVRTRGIFHAGYLIPWDQIKSWYWEDLGRPSTSVDNKELRDPLRQKRHLSEAKSGIAADQPAILRVELLNPLYFQRSFRIIIPSIHANDVATAMNSHILER